MTPLQWDLTQLLKRNRDGSHVTQYDRRKIVMQFAKDLHTLGFRGLRLRNVRQKHIQKVLHVWKTGNPYSQPVSEATVKNRLANVRWVLEKVGKSNLLPDTNRSLGIEARTYLSEQSRAVPLTEDVLKRVTDNHVYHSFRMQAAFGLRREEAMKVEPTWADRGDKLVLKSSWTKGGRPREIPIRTQQQREVLNAAKAFAKNGSLIPARKSYREHVMTWEYQTRRAGLSKTHGLRHAYAQRRYEELTGRKAQILGGTPTIQLEGALREKDREARLQIAAELGHSRIDITSTYLGR